MKSRSIIFSFITFLVLFSPGAFAGDIEWSGVYRVEGYALNNPELRSQQTRDLNYAQSHLVLRPKINAGDGLTIFGQFNIFNNSDYPSSQMGQFFGSGVRSTGTTASSDSTSNTISKRQKADTLEVSQLYLTLNQEFGQLIVGRAPIHFGLGMTHNAGRGLFDHWYDSRDLVGYKVIMGNLYFLPMFGKPLEGAINQSDDLDDYMIQVQYENPDTDTEMGVFYQIRKGGDQASDAPLGGAAGNAFGGAGATNSGGVNSKSVSVYALRDTERYRLGLEGTFQSGNTGVQTASGEQVTWDGVGLAVELEYRPQDSRWKWALKGGSASGDDPTTNSKFEGFVFNRNYDVAMLMFNHPMGQADFLRTRAITGSVYDTGTTNINRADVEAISNVLYLAPTAHYAFNDRWSLNNTVITGWLGTNPIIGGPGSKDLGYEYDLSVNFAPRKGILWVNQMGLLFPGSGWKVDSDADGTYESPKFSFGLSTKAAISF